MREELFTSREAIDAIKSGQPMPVITMEDYRDNELYRYFVMEKRTGWGTRHSSELRTGEWEFQWFNPNRTVKVYEDLDRCRSCHTSQAGRNYIFTVDRRGEPKSIMSPERIRTFCRRGPTTPSRRICISDCVAGADLV